MRKNRYFVIRPGASTKIKLFSLRARFKLFNVTNLISMLNSNLSYIFKANPKDFYAK